VIVVCVRSWWSRSKERLEWSCLTRATCLQSDRSVLVTTFCSLLMKFRPDSVELAGQLTAYSLASSGPANNGGRGLWNHLNFPKMCCFERLKIRHLLLRTVRISFRLLQTLSNFRELVHRTSRPTYRHTGPCHETKTFLWPIRNFVTGVATFLCCVSACYGNSAVCVSGFSMAETIFYSSLASKSFICLKA